MTAKKTKTIKGYKVFNNDWTCRGFQYEIGKTYRFEGEIKLCEAGFHFCEKLEDCFENYACVQWNKIAEVEASGKIKKGRNKCVTDTLTILKEIEFSQIAEIIKEQNSRGVSSSFGVSSNFGVSSSYGMLDCSGVSKGLFCAGKKNEFYLFNKKVKKNIGRK